jgi:4-amino-4-deoxy-L-arabinose transferase-like glycosyltransferase
MSCQLTIARASRGRATCLAGAVARGRGPLESLRTFRPSCMAPVMIRLLTQRISAWFRREDTRYELSLIAFTLVVRIMTSAIQIGPDPNQKWGFARQVLAGRFPTAAGFNHHHARWGVNIPLIITQSFFGQEASSIAITPILFAIIQSILLYHIGKRLNGPAAGVIAAVLPHLVPSAGYMLSTVQTLAFERVYILVTLYALIRSADVRHSKWLALACVSGFFAYLAKETTVFVLPGLAYLAWISRGRLKDAIVFSASFVALFLTETLLYRLTFGFKLGRATIISAHHMGVPKLKIRMTFWQLFDRYLHLEPVVNFLFYGALVASLVVPFWYRLRKREPVPMVLKGTLAATWSFFLGTTFALKSINPLLPAQPPLPRYLLPGVPLLALLVGWALVEWGAPLVRPLGRKLDLRRALVAVPLVAALGVLLVLRPAWSKTGIARTKKLESAVQQAFETGAPILIKERKSYLRNVERSIRFLYLTYPQARRMLVIEGPGGTRAVVDRTRPEFSASEPDLRKRVAEWKKKARPLGEQGFSVVEVKTTAAKKSKKAKNAH